MRAVQAVLAVACCIALGASAGTAGSKLRSASEFLSPELSAEQADEVRNRGMLWVDQGLALWDAPAGPAGKPCAS